MAANPHSLHLLCGHLRSAPALSQGLQDKAKGWDMVEAGGSGIGTCPGNPAMVLDRGIHWKPIRNVRALRNQLLAFLRSLLSQHTRFMGKEPKALGFQPHCPWTSP